MSGRRRTTLEAEIQRQVEIALGSEADLLLMRNSVGQARYTNDEGRTYVVPYGVGGRGAPDLVGILAPSGTWLCLELKVPGEDATPEQEKVHALWRRFGALVFVAHSVDEARAALEDARSRVRAAA